MKDVEYKYMRERFLPICRQDMKDRGWDRVDFVYITGDAYVDHPSFGPAVITRLLESRGYRIGIISQPDWKDKDSVTIYGEPRLAFLVSAGNMDSMVNHYSVSKKRRKSDAYTPGGVMGRRPDYATVVYGNLIRQTYKQTPVILGGIEASLRRLAHYDYWSDRLKRSVLLDSGADMISYGMGEHSIVEIAEALDAGIAVSDITYISGTTVKTKSLDSVYDAVMLPSFEELKADRLSYARSFYTQYCNTDPFSGKRLVEPYSEHLYVVQNPPAKPLTQMEMDDVYALPFTRCAHPDYEKLGGVPATAEIKFSLISNRGCFGGCSFCALTFHQGRIVQTRSHESLLQEAKEITQDPDFKGYIHDVGGPTANFRHPSCEKQMTKGVCKTKQCLFPTPCKNLNADHTPLLDIYKEVDSMPEIKRSFIGSGIRYDLLLHRYADDNLNKAAHTYMEELIARHVSGRLKVAPEHTEDNVLKMMRKPSFELFGQFKKIFDRVNKQHGLNQQLIPYFISSHPGCTEADMANLAIQTKKLHFQLEQVQDFTPTPMTLATEMYYTGYHPYTLEKVYTAHTKEQKLAQRQFFFWYKPEFRRQITQALQRIGKKDLIGKLFGR